jgi:hypothetical protein
LRTRRIAVEAFRQDGVLTVSVHLARQYYDLYQRLDIVPGREKEPDEPVKNRLFNTKKFF